MRLCQNHNSEFSIQNSEFPCAFTLTELIVIAIIGIITGLGLSAFAGAVELAREQRTRSIIAKIDQLIMERYELTAPAQCRSTRHHGRPPLPTPRREPRIGSTVLCIDADGTARPPARYRGLLIKPTKMAKHRRRRHARRRLSAKVVLSVRRLCRQFSRYTRPGQPHKMVSRQ